LAAAISIDIEGEINGARAVAQLAKLAGVEMGAQRTGEVAKPACHHTGIVEQSFDQNHLGALPHSFPGIQATLGGRQEAMGEGVAEAAAVGLTRRPSWQPGKTTRP